VLNVSYRSTAAVLQSMISSKSTIEENYVKYMQSLDPIKLFIEMAINKMDVSADKRLTKEQVYEAYEGFGAYKKVNKESSGTLSRRLKDEGYKYEQTRMGKIRTYVWVNIELKDWKEAEEGQETL
jgi:Txe/YoeB family toxin of Txe-Axe toxin-antitoxin module